jgi:hypothetical protein
VHLYFHLKKIFYPSHQNSLLYTHFSRTHIISITYSIPTIPYFIPLPLSFSLPLTFSLSQLQCCYSVYRGLLRVLGLASSCAAGTIPEALQVSGTRAQYAIAGVPVPLQVSGAVSLRLSALGALYSSATTLARFLACKMRHSAVLEKCL